MFLQGCWVVFCRGIYDVVLLCSLLRFHFEDRLYRFTRFTQVLCIRSTAVILKFSSEREYTMLLNNKGNPEQHDQYACELLRLYTCSLASTKINHLTTMTHQWQNNTWCTDRWLPRTGFRNLITPRHEFELKFISLYRGGNLNASSGPDSRTPLFGCEAPSSSHGSSSALGSDNVEQQ